MPELKKNTSTEPPNLLVILGLGAGLFASLMILAVLAGGYLINESAVVLEVDLTPFERSAELEEAHQKAKENITTVRELDSGRYQIPITHAMELMAKGK